MILGVDKDLAKLRITICESCIHFRKRTRTCGTPIVGNKVGKKRTCGCFMDVKTKLSFSNCPLDKWYGKDLSHSDYLEMKQLISEVKYTINSKQKKVLFSLLSKYTGSTKQTSQCASCLIKALDDIKEIIKQYES